MEKVRELSIEYDNPDYPVLVEFVESNSDSMVPEWRICKNDAQIMVVNYGIVNIEVEDDIYNVTSGQAFLLNMGIPYKLTASSKTVSYYAVRFNPEFIMEREYTSKIAKKYYDTIDDKEKFRALLLDESNLRDETVLDKINSIIAINHTKTLGYEMITKGYLCHLWVALLELVLHKRGSFNTISLPTQDELRVKMAVDYLKENYADEITLESIAERIHVSRSECCRCFKRVIGIPPVDYLIKLRIFEAARLIYKDPGAFSSFSELAFMVGFNNVSYFNKMFKRILEMTPTNFQRQLRLGSTSVKKLYDSLENVVNEY